MHCHWMRHFRSRSVFFLAKVSSGHLQPTDILIFPFDESLLLQMADYIEQSVWQLWKEQQGIARVSSHIAAVLWHLMCRVVQIKWVSFLFHISKCSKSDDC